MEDPWSQKIGSRTKMQLATDSNDAPVAGKQAKTPHQTVQSTTLTHETTKMKCTLGQLCTK